MRLLDVIAALGDLDDASTIYAQAPWTPQVEAIITLEPNEGGLPPKAVALGLSYFLEVAVAREFLHDWTTALSSAPSLNEQCERLIKYAINDA